MFFLSSLRNVPRRSVCYRKGYASGLDALSFHELAGFRIPSGRVAMDVGAEIELRILIGTDTITLRHSIPIP